MRVFSVYRFVIIFLVLANSCCRSAKENLYSFNQLVTTSNLFQEKKERSVRELKDEKRHVIVVFIHGTVLPVFSFSSIVATAQDFFVKSNNHSMYQQYLNKLRSNSFYKFQPISGFGLNSVPLKHDYNNLHKSDATKKIALCYRSIMQRVFSDYGQYFIYTFGWEGRLDAQNRKEAASRLYENLVFEVEKKRKELGDDKPIEIHLIAHSHGGNVVLNLSSVAPSVTSKLTIDKVVLLGTPIQSETASLVTSPMFKSVYNVYSRGDMVQVADIISTKDDWSSRVFTLSRNVEKYKHIRQFSIQVGKQKPRHIELWFWGSEQVSLYRKKLIINPFPVVCFIPILFHLAENAQINGREGTFSIDKSNNNFICKLLKSQEDGTMIAHQKEEVIALNSDIVSSYIKLAFLDS